MGKICHDNDLKRHDFKYEIEVDTLFKNDNDDKNIPKEVQHWEFEKDSHEEEDSGEEWGSGVETDPREEDSESENDNFHELVRRTLLAKLKTTGVTGCVGIIGATGPVGYE